VRTPGFKKKCKKDKQSIQEQLLALEAMKKKEGGPKPTLLKELFDKRNLMKKK